MLRRIIAMLLIASLFTANFSRFFIYAGFEMNRDYIAAKLCENRNKPQLHCNGKCYLMKKIKQAEDKQNNQDRQSQKNLFQEAFFPQIAAIKFHTHLLQVMYIPNNRFLLPQIAGTIFQPPKLG